MTETRATPAPVGSSRSWSEKVYFCQIENIHYVEFCIHRPSFKAHWFCLKKNSHQLQWVLAGHGNLGGRVSEQIAYNKALTNFLS